MSVIDVKRWGVIFKKNKGNVMRLLEKEDRGEALAIKACSADCVVIKSETHSIGSMWGGVSPKKLLELICENRGIYEITNKFPHKVYFDIDKEGREDGFLDKIKNSITKYFPNCEFAISGSYTETKTSFHIILTNYVIHNVEEQLYMKHTVRYMKANEDEAFDWVVYRKGNFKAVNQSKPDGRIQAIIENVDLKAHLITCFLPSYPLPFQEAPKEIKEYIQIEKAKGAFDVMSLPKLNLVVPEGIVWLELEAEQALLLIPAKDLTHEHSILVARFCKTEGISLEKFIKWNSAKWEHRKYTKTLISEKIQYWKSVWNGKYVAIPFSLEKLKQTFLKHFYKHIAKDIHFGRFEKSFELPESNKNKIETLSQDEFNGTEKITMFNIGMGGGKTAQTCDFLKYEQSFCWIAPNRALAHNTFNRLEDAGINGLKHYSREPKKDKLAKSLMKYDKIIIVLNSLHYLFTKDYRVIVIDEIETLIDKWFGNFMTNPIKQNNWTVFVNIIRKAEKVILLDAFITTKTINLMKAICPNVEYRIYERKIEPITREVHYNNDFAFSIRNLIDDLKAGLKLFIFYPYKNQSKMNSSCVSMEAFYQMLITETGKKGEYYNSDIDEKTKIGLRDVNVNWKDLDFVITNMIITCGVNYDETDFDKEYIFVTSFTSPRDAVQVTYRPRTLNTNRINVCYLGRMTQTNSWEVDTEVLLDPIYTAMIESILIERKSPLRKTLQMFFDKAHYSQHMHKDKVQEIIGKEITEMLEKYGNLYGYKSIEDIDGGYAEIINQRMFSGEATRTEKMMFQKFWFKNQFTDEGQTICFPKDLYVETVGCEILNDCNALESAWNDNYGYFFTQVKRLLANPNNVFERLKKANKWTSIFPKDIKKTIITDDIKKQIFKDFKFKFVSETSCIPKILEQIYNSYFMRQIIIPNFNQETKHTTYSLKDEATVKYFYNFYELHRFKSENNEIFADDDEDFVCNNIKCACCNLCEDKCSCNKIIQNLKTPTFMESWVTRYFD